MNVDLQRIDNESNITIRSLAVALRNFAAECRRRWRWLAWLMALGVCIAAFKKYHHPRKFEAEVSFMLNEENSANSGLHALLGQFGGVLGTGSDINLKKILELAKTRRIAEQLFFDSVEIDGRGDLLANHLIAELEKHGRWIDLPFYKKNHPLKGFRFANTQIGDFGRLENLALKQLHQLFLKMLATESSEVTGIMKIKIQNTHESLCYHLGHRLFEHMSNFYIDKTIEKQQTTYLALKHKADSLKALIERKEYMLANINDSYRSGYLYREEVPKTLLDRDLKTLSIIYGEALKNQEIASFSLENRMPFIQAIDLPILPLKAIEFKWYKALLLGLLGGLFAGLLAVAAVSIYNREMSATDK